MSTNSSQTQNGAHGSSNPQKVLNRTPALRKKRGRNTRSVSPHMLDNSINNAVGPSPKKIIKSSTSPVSFKPNPLSSLHKTLVNPNMVVHDEINGNIDDNRSYSDNDDSIDLNPSEDILVSSDNSSEFELPTAAEPKFTNFDYSKITKNLPRFRGTDDDHFEAWMANVRLFLREQCAHLTDHQKVTAVLLRIEGYPRFILSGIIKSLKSVKDIFKALKQTYGQDELTMLANIKQLPDETVRVYYSRMKTNLGLLGYHDATKGKRIYLNYFLSGLLPRLRSQVENLMPQRLEDALALANSFESKNSANDSKRSKKLNEDYTEKLNSFGNQSEKARYSSNNKKLNDRLNNMSEKLNELLAMIKH